MSLEKLFCEPVSIGLVLIHFKHNQLCMVTCAARIMVLIHFKHNQLCMVTCAARIVGQSPDFFHIISVDSLRRMPSNHSGQVSSCVFTAEVCHCSADT